MIRIISGFPLPNNLIALFVNPRNKYRAEALACGFRTSSESSLDMLFNWADMAILLAPQYKELLKPEWDKKTKV